MSPTVALSNTSANLSGKTAVLAEVDQTITGLQTFNRGTGSPFAVNLGAAKVDNLGCDNAVNASYAVTAGSADKLDGLDSTAFLQKTEQVVVRVASDTGGSTNLAPGNLSAFVVPGFQTTKDVLVITITLSISGTPPGVIVFDVLAQDPAARQGAFLLTGATAGGDMGADTAGTYRIEMRPFQTIPYLQCLGWGGVTAGAVQTRGFTWVAAVQSDFTTAGTNTLFLRQLTGLGGATCRYAWSIYLLKG